MIEGLVILIVIFEAGRQQLIKAYEIEYLLVLICERAQMHACILYSSKMPIKPLVR